MKKALPTPSLGDSQGGVRRRPGRIMAGGLGIPPGLRGDCGKDGSWGGGLLRDAARERAVAFQSPDSFVKGW